MDVEIKVNFGASQIERAKQVFALDRESKERNIWFGEVVTGLDGRCALPLLGRGVILRVRTKKKDSGDVTLKLRGPDGGIDVAAWTAAGLAGEKKIEGDWADRRLVSASLTADFGQEGRDELKKAQPLIIELMSTAQKDLAPALFVPLDAVTLLGSITARKWDPESGIAAEQWEVRGERFLEISVLAKEGQEDPEQVQQELRQRVLDGHLTLEEGQEPKTTRVLKLLAGETG